MGLPSPATQELSQGGKYFWASEEGFMPLLRTTHSYPSAVSIKEGWPSLWSTAALRHSITTALREESLTWCRIRQNCVCSMQALMP